MKRFLILFLTFSVLLLSACGKESTEVQDLNATYATVNGEIITVEEIEYFKSRYKSDIINDFAEKYGVTDFSDFWDNTYGGESPTDALESLALDYAVSAKIKLVEMKKLDIFTDISFSGLKNKAQQYNSSHENKSGTVGVSSIDLDSFYTYYVETGEMELKNRLVEGDLKPTQDEIDSYISQHGTENEDTVERTVAEQKYNSYIDGLISSAEIVKK